MEFGKSNWRTFEQGIEKEWLLTNGIGGFSSSTLIGANTRRYHGLLVAALKPPVGRHLILSKVDESVAINGKSYDLAAFRTPDYVMKGYHHLQYVRIDHLPAFIYSVEDVFLEKKVCMVYGENTVAVQYRIINGGSPVKLRLTPLVNFRDYHHNSHRHHMVFRQQPHEKGVFIKPYDLELDIRLYCSEGTYAPLEDSWFYNMDYPVERERGLQSTEDHYIPGYFEVDVRQGEDKSITFIATVEKEMAETDATVILCREENRIKSLLDRSGYKDELALKLVAAADDFIVYRDSTHAKTIIAGYPWFTDWGRDTMIAFTGLTLATKRFEDAKQILYTFSLYINHGLLPNMFPDEGQEPGYNTVDAALWYFEAVGKYLKYTGDYDFIKDNIYNVLKEIINAYTRGTLFKIGTDEDGLVTAGDMHTQLTWMDAKAGDWVVTPRHGKAVEINALWYNALRIAAGLASRFGESSNWYEKMAWKVKDSFVKTFWNEREQCLYDVVTADYRDDKVRPNQIMAVSLSNAVLEGEKARKVVEKVWKLLYTAYGLRSLSPASDEYRGVYMGDQHQRDGAYHQGTVWTWPLGQFVTAFLKVNHYSEESRNIAMRFIKPFEHHLNDACIGSISEIFDGEEPLVPRGCFAQAWSVGEILRAYVEDVLGDCF